MSVRLTVKQRSAEGGADKPSVVMLDDDIITLGRDQVCQVVLAQQAVSRSHARISRDGQLYFVEDLGSSFGTQINGQKLPKGEKHLLRNGDVIAIAQFDVTFDRIAGEKASEAANNTQFVARKVVKDVMRGLMANGEQPYFRIMNGPREGERIEIADAQEYIIGRDESADIIFKDDLVSRRHVKVRRDWSGVHVEDLGSRNGIKINKKRSSGKTLLDRDEVEVGGVRLLFLDPNEVREAPVVISDDPEGEMTSREKDEEVAENQRAKKKSARVSRVEKKEPAPPPEEAPAEPPPEEPPPAEEPPSDEPNTSQDPPPDEEPPPEEPPPDDVSPDDAPPDEGEPGAVSGERRGLDLSNKSTMVGIGIGAFALLIGIVVLILLVAGA
ncbi:MAG: FHA domain-containing protein [Myxococcaceae bacterium]|nr:FHA domain-containing protein [Myxococcaceae bacterium]